MYYLEIVDLFDVITDVKVDSAEKTITVYGLSENTKTSYSQHYQHLKVAKEVAKRLMYFKGINKNSKKFN